MKNPSDSLYQLIRSLTSEEKRYFKKFASFNIQGGNKNYVILFDYITRMKKYDEELLKRKLSGRKFIKHFWKTKNYLYKIILKSLRSYHSENIRDLKTSEVYDNLLLLHQKGLYGQCRKLLNTAKKMCYDYEMYAELLKLLIFEKKLISSTRFSGISEKDIRILFDEINDTIEKIKNWNEYQYYSTKLFDLIKKKGSVKSSDDLVDIKEIIKQPIYEDVSNALTFDTKLSFYNAHYFYNYLSRDFDNCLRYSEKMIDLFGSSTLKMKSRYDTYIKIITNYLEVCLLTSNFDSFKCYFEILKLLSPGLKNYNIFIVLANLELEYYIKSGEYETGIKFINQIIPSLDTIEGEANEMRKCSFYYNVAYLYFLKNDYSVSLYYLNKILNNKCVKDELEVIYYTRLLNLIIHYELGNFKLLQYILKSTYRFLSKRQRVFKIEKQIYYFIRSSFRFKTDEELNYSFYELRQRLLESSSNPFERGVFNYIDLISWLDSKISNRQFSEVLIDKINSTSGNKKEVTSHQAKLPL